MKISCAYCRKIHDKSYDCGKKPTWGKGSYKKMKYDKDRFRSTAAWQKKAEEIKERDHYLCQICFRNLYRTTSRLNSTELSVHHVVPLKEAYELRLENDNLITLCGRHHREADKGLIPLNIIKEIIRQQEKSTPG